MKEKETEFFSRSVVRTMGQVQKRSFSHVPWSEQWGKYTLEALAYALSNTSSSLSSLYTKLPDLQKKYGKDANADDVRSDELKLYLRKKIIKASKNIRNITSQVDFELQCFPETKCTLSDIGIIENKPANCKNADQCCLFKHMKPNKTALDAMIDALDGSNKNENIKRKKALKEIVRSKNASRFNNKLCRNIGDAAFVHYCKSDECILTTNMVDHALLAKKLKIRVFEPRHKISLLQDYNNKSSDAA